MRNTVLLVLVGLLMAACADISPTAPSSMRPGFGAVAATGQATLFRNAHKYKDTGRKPATLRAGDASLTVLAMLGSDGVTTVTVQAGAPGTLARAQFKLLDAQGNLQSTLTQNDINTSTLQLTLTDRPAGSLLDVRATIRGLNGNRANVVSVTEIVKRRPDLTISSLNAPQSALVGAPVPVSAVISELNGDLGARANCVLYADGVQVDQALGIWVDAAGVVSCAFKTAFTTVGKRHLTVAVENGDPLEWSTANNSAAVDVDIIDPADVNHFVWSAEAMDYRSISQYDNRYTWQRTDSPETRDYSFTESYDNRIQLGSLSGYSTQPVSFPLSVEASQSEGGQLLHSLSLHDQAADWTSVTDGVTQACITRDQALPFTMSDGTVVYWSRYQLSVCSYSDPAGNYQQTSVSYAQQAGDVTYHSRGYDYYTNNGVLSDYSYHLNRDLNATIAPLVPGADSYSFRVKLTGSDGVVEQVVADVHLDPWTQDITQPESCSTTSAQNYTETSCWEYRIQYSGFRGTATGLPQN